MFGTIRNKLIWFLRKVVRTLFQPLLLEALNSNTKMSFLSAPQSDCPIHLYIRQRFFYNTDGHYHNHYVEWRMRRITKVIDIFGIDFFQGKRILELGGGIGDIGAFFASIGAHVTSAEFRATNRNFAALRYRDIPNFQTVFFDGEQDFNHLAANGKFDVILVFGFIEVISNINSVMDCCMQMSDNVLLETMVCDSTNPDVLIYVDLSPEGIDNPSLGRSARPSPAYIEQHFMKNSWTYERHFTSDLNTPDHCYDWIHKNDMSSKDGYRRFWHFHRPGNNSHA